MDLPCDGVGPTNTVEDNSGCRDHEISGLKGELQSLEAGYRKHLSQCSGERESSIPGSDTEVRQWAARMERKQQDDRMERKQQDYRMEQWAERIEKEVWELKNQMKELRRGSEINNNIEPSLLEKQKTKTVVPGKNPPNIQAGTEDLKRRISRLCLDRPLNQSGGACKDSEAGDLTATEADYLLAKFKKKLHRLVDELPKKHKEIRQQIDDLMKDAIANNYQYQMRELRDGGYTVRRYLAERLKLCYREMCRWKECILHQVEELDDFDLLLLPAWEFEDLSQMISDVPIVLEMLCSDATNHMDILSACFHISKS